MSSTPLPLLGQIKTYWDLARPSQKRGNFEPKKLHGGTPEEREPFRRPLSPKSNTTAPNFSEVPVLCFLWGNFVMWPSQILLSLLSQGFWVFGKVAMLVVFQTTSRLRKYDRGREKSHDPADLAQGTIKPLSRKHENCTQETSHARLGPKNTQKILEKSKMAFLGPISYFSVFKIFVAPAKLWANTLNNNGIFPNFRA